MEILAHNALTWIASLTLYKKSIFCFENLLWHFTRILQLNWTEQADSLHSVAQSVGFMWTLVAF